jgi:predicted metal-dependent hydrolase
MAVAPPQRYPRGGRPALDAQWLAYLHDGGAVGDGSLLLADSCLARSIDVFNQGDYLDAHERFEASWRDAPYPERLCCLALAKLSAGFAHAQNGNRAGAVRMVQDCLRWTPSFEPAYAGLDVSRLVQEIARWLSDYWEGGEAPTFPLIHSTEQKRPPGIRRGA